MGKRPGSSGFNGTRKKGGRGHGPGGKMINKIIAEKINNGEIVL